MHNSHVHETSFSPPLSSATCGFRAAIFPRALSPAALRASYFARCASLEDIPIRDSADTSTSTYYTSCATRSGRGFARSNLRKPHVTRAPSRVEPTRANVSTECYVTDRRWIDGPSNCIFEEATERNHRAERLRDDGDILVVLIKLCYKICTMLGEIFFRKYISKSFFR